LCCDGLNKEVYMLKDSYLQTRNFFKLNTLDPTNMQHILKLILQKTICIHYKKALKSVQSVTNYMH
jgi:hypothetical protein